YCASDNIFADVNNNDMPDMVFARMTAQNATHLETMVTKFLDNERTPPTNPDYYQNPITALGFQTERWFQICSESVAGFWEVVHGKTANRINAIYSGSPTTTWSTATNTATVLNVFGPNGLGYIPATPGEVSCTWNGNGQDVINGINSGAFMLQHRDHGSTTGWGEPDFQSSDINSLNNTDLTFVWSINCLTGKFNMSGECFAEKFHRHTSGGNNSGALGINAASEISYSFVNDTYVWGAYDNMWPEFLPDYGTTPDARGILPAFGNAAGKYFLQQSSWPYNTSNKEVTYNLFHHHGDAFMMVYSEIPQNLTVNHNPILYAGVTSFDVTANDGALIALTVDGEIIGTAEGTGGPVSITIPAQQPPNNMVVTITLQNYYRYSEVVEVIPPSGPYVVYNEVEINDAAGNGNGLMETSESILASLTIENVGVEEAINVSVTIQTADPYVTVTDNNEVYGNISAGAIAVVTDGFAWDVADNIPDLHQVIFEVNATDVNDTTWTTFFGVVGHGPNLEVGNLTIDDSNGGNGNGRLDPGEDADILIETYNNGSYQAIGAIGTISITSPFITVNNSTFDFNVLGSGSMEEAVFSISIDAGAPIGTVISVEYDVTSGGYSVQESFGTTIGLILEDWETGDMSQYEWETGGNGNWTVVNTGAYEGTYCAKSGSINDNQSTYLELEYDVFSDDVISFWLKVSSEGSYDFLRFFIDGNEQASWSGEVAWQEAEYAVTGGIHTFKWVYDKDYSVSGGSDCGWVDFIVLPAPPMTTAYAGPDGEICEDNPYQTQGGATLYNIVYWQTSGNGSFDNTQILNAVYTASQADIDAGSVILTMTAYGPDYNVSDEMTLTIHSVAVAMAGEDAIVCSGLSYELLEASVEDATTVLWETAGDGTFDDATLVNPTYTPGTGDLANGMVTLTFNAYSSGDCDDAMDDIVLTFVDAATAYAGAPATICSDADYDLNEATAENYVSLMWATDGDGTFDDNTSMNPVYSPGTSDIDNGTALLTLTAYGNGNCGEVSAELSLTIVHATEAFAGEDNTVLSGETYTVADATAMHYSDIMWITSGDGTFDDASALNPTYTPGTNDIDAKEVTLSLTSYGNSPCGEMSDDMMLSISTGIGENMAGFEMSVFPNPNSGSFTLELNGENNEEINIRIYNSLSDVVFEKENISVQGSHTETLNLDVEQGVYYIRIEGNELLINRKIVIRK
ncbi:MAG: T9SS type A sorting domain-containing protein, partial [Bacteroidales bacterium]|nr:T9SS type A sorting domain-containing protein [Bacteroidales bacterium]